MSFLDSEVRDHEYINFIKKWFFFCVSDYIFYSRKMFQYYDCFLEPIRFSWYLGRLGNLENKYKKTRIFT